MHEWALMKALVTKVLKIARERGAKRVIQVVVRLGAFSHSDGDRLRTLFTTLTEGTIAEGADLKVLQTDEFFDLVLEGVTLEVGENREG